MKNFAERIRLVRSRIPGRSSEDFGKLLASKTKPNGVSGAAVRGWENGKGITAENLALIAASDGVSIEWLTTGRGSMMADKNRDGTSVVNNSDGISEKDATIRKNELYGDGLADLPVFAARSVGGDEMMLLKSTVEIARRPNCLVGIIDAYGIAVASNSMYPSFRPGETIWIDTLRPIVKDSDVMLFRTDAEGVTYGIVRCLVDYSETEWTVERPAGISTRECLSRSYWTECFRVAGKEARR